MVAIIVNIIYINMISGSKKIARNTLMLYIRMLLSMIINLYTSRIILQNLGIVDYGIYNVVSGTVLLLSFLNNALSGSTSRFLNFEKHNNDDIHIKKVFSASLTIHLIVGLVIILFAESLGIWLMQKYLVIPNNRMDSAYIIYQIAVIIGVVQIVQIPFLATIIANEKMEIYAYISIIEVILKLCVAYFIAIIQIDKLVSYGILMMLTSVCIAVTYILYSLYSFNECTLKICIEKRIIKPILSFSMWDLYGNLCVISNTHLINIIINVFFGTTMNAANAIANQVRYAVGGFSANFLTAVKPQLVKSYASNDIKYLINIVVNSSKLSYLLMFVVSLPLIVENEYVLKLWLVNLPEKAIIFCQINLIYGIINAMFYPTIIAIHATGNVKGISFITGSIYLLAVPITYLLLKLGYDSITPFIVNIIILIIASINNHYLLKQYIKDFSSKIFFKEVIKPCFIVSLISVLVVKITQQMLPPSLFRLIIVILSSVFVNVILIYFCVLDRIQKRDSLNYVKKIIGLNIISIKNIVIR